MVIDYEIERQVTHLRNGWRVLEVSKETDSDILTRREIFFSYQEQNALKALSARRERLATKRTESADGHH